MDLSRQAHYGKGSPKPRPIKVPSGRLFMDFGVNGAVHVMLSSLLEGATIRDLLPLENIFSFPAPSLLPILYDIDKRLSEVWLYLKLSSLVFHLTNLIL